MRRGGREEVKLKFYPQTLAQDFPGGKNLPANARSMGLIPRLGRFHGATKPTHPNY